MKYKILRSFNEAFHVSSCMGPKEKVNSITEYWEVLVVELKGSVPAVSRTGCGGGGGARKKFAGGHRPGGGGRGGGGGGGGLTKILAWVTDLGSQTLTQNLLLTTLERVYVDFL